MSILIKDMEMPRDCHLCPISHWNKLDEFTGCEFKKRYFSKEELNQSGRPEFCPLIEIPPHGRLCDLDALEQDAQKRLLMCNKNDNQFQKPYEVMRAIALAPTIIPADKEET